MITELWLKAFLAGAATTIIAKLLGRDKLPQSGALLVKGLDPSGKPLDALKDDKDSVAYFLLGRPKLIPPEDCFVKVDQPIGYEEAWTHKPIRVSAGHQTKVDLTIHKARR
jgi:hypothetical protein